MDSNEFLENKVNTVIKVILRYANKNTFHNDDMTDRYFWLLADSLGAILSMKIPFSEKIKAIEFVIHDISNDGVIGLAKEYVNLAVEQAIEFDKNEVKQ